MANGERKPGEDAGRAVDPSRRTRLANERTLLAWWRTGLAALAVGIGVGRVVPELSPEATSWPYVVAGVGFALWGMVAIAYGSAHAGAVGRALEQGEFSEPAPWALRSLTAAGVVLGLLTAGLIVFD